MSNFLLRLLVHHGMWNEKDHDIFKSIISTCKGMYQYVHLNKSLVKMLFEHFSLQTYISNMSYCELNNKLQGISERWGGETAGLYMQPERRSYHKSKKHLLKRKKLLS